MAARSIASLSLSFGLVSIPVKLYSATESSGAVKFNMLAKDGSRLKQQYVSEKDQAVVPRSEMVKGYEFEKDRFVLFSPEELKALEESSSPSIDIISFIPEKSVDPLFYDKAYLLAPDKRCARATAARWRSGPGRPSNTWCRSGRPRTAWCCSSCCTRPKCARTRTWTSRRSMWRRANCSWRCS